MRNVEVSEVQCDACGGIQPVARWGGACATCGETTFSVEIERSSSGIDWSNLVASSSSGLGGGDLSLLVDAAFDDAGPSSPYYRTDAFLRTPGVPCAALKEFLEASLEDRIRLYISWKRREVEASLPPGHRICRRCRGEFKVYDNEWGRAGLCSRVCHHAFLRSRPRDS
ncbi:MAG TPA: hypothetical protein VMU54_08610 [Planctomycetota bacterium]|nr:hypothetical protein [Planctomycetota bacterium]